MQTDERDATNELVRICKVFANYKIEKSEYENFRMQIKNQLQVIAEAQKEKETAKQNRRNERKFKNTSLRGV